MSVGLSDANIDGMHYENAEIPPQEANGASEPVFTGHRNP